uniref:Apple domain-containing protein n=1 Tax=Clytia hemisphaerica TaxID=252671 RepID=A0A7M5VEJ2_9CNID
MNIKIRKLVILLFCTLHQIQASKFQHFEITRGKKIVVDQNLTLQTTKADSILICSHKCQLHLECEYANYLESRKQCQLIGGHPNNIFVDEEGSIVLSKNVRTMCSYAGVEDQGDDNISSSTTTTTTATTTTATTTTTTTPSSTTTELVTTTAASTQPVTSPSLYSWSRDQEFATVKGTILDTIPTQTKSWKLEMTIKLLQISNKETNILRILNPDISTLNNPGLFVEKDSTDLCF